MSIGTIHPVWAEEPLAQESPQAALLDSQEIALKFEGNLEDASGNNISVSSPGNVSYAEGISGQALSLDGKTYLDLGTSEKLQPAELTVSFWLKATKALSGEHIIMWNKTSGA